MNKSPIEVLFDTCQELMSKEHIRSLAHFKEECKKDKVIGEGVASICKAMERYADMRLEETNIAWKKDHQQLQVSRLIEEKKAIELQELVGKLQAEIADLKKDSVIAE